MCDAQSLAGPAPNFRTLGTEVLPCLFLMAWVGFLPAKVYAANVTLKILANLAASQKTTTE